MKLKLKVALGVVFLFIAILTVGGIALYYIHDLSAEAKNILKDNYETLQYTKRIIESCDSLQADSSKAMAVLEQNLKRQEANITEAGEQEMTSRLRAAFERMKADGITNESLAVIRRESMAIQEINMQAIVLKNEQTEKSSDKAVQFVMIFVSLVSIVAFTFIVNFPGYIANPISQLTASIKSIANKNYEERLHFDRQDEFKELSEAFNQMAEKLDEYEHSNLANLLFEKKRIETIINKMSDPIVGLDEKKRILFVNTEAIKILGVCGDDLIGKYAPDEAIHNDLLRHLLKDVVGTPVFDEKEQQPLKIVSDGKENYFTKDILKVTTVPTGEKKVTLIGYVIILKNITPFKELDLAKTNFIATISHELKTPLASIEMCAQLLEDARVGNLNGEQKEILKTINEETSRLKRITGELLNMAQVETGNIRLDMTSVNPRDIMTYATRALKFQADQKQLVIEIQCPEDLPSVKADLDKTTWVMINLLSNAIHYSPEGSKIILRARHDNGKVVFSVIDQGRGIDPSLKDKVFDKFYRVPGAESTGSTGLGLAISKEVISSEGGNIWVESEVSKGTTFSFELTSS